MWANNDSQIYYWKNQPAVASFLVFLLVMIQDYKKLRQQDDKQLQAYLKKAVLKDENQKQKINSLLQVLFLIKVNYLILKID